MSAPTGIALMEEALALGRRAGRVALDHYRRGLAIELKSDGSPVTIADRAAERAAREWVAARHPADGFVGEELGEANPGARRRWIVDPIDGTKAFVRGVPLWGTLVAVVEGETVLAGAAVFPAVDEAVSAAPEAGAWWNGTRCRVSGVDELAAATVLTTDERFTEAPARRAGWERLAREARVSRTWGDCFGYLLLVTGRAEVMADPVMNAWDAAALQPIVVEAGGAFTSWEGAPTAFGGSVIATNTALAARARALLTTP